MRRQAARTGYGALLFASGGTALVYELLWSKHLGNVLGNSGEAQALTLAVFMGGLALGARVLGGVADRSRNPLAVYAYLELGVAVCALLFEGVLGGLHDGYVALAAWLPEAHRNVARLLFAAAALVPPTVLMGGTLPALVRHATHQLDELHERTASLYGWNSLGAAVGVLGAGVWWVPQWGLGRVAHLAAAVNVLVGVAAWVVSRSHVPRPPTPVQVPLAVRSVALVALVAAAISGGTTMLYEVVWIRLLTLVLGSSTYVFPVILSAFILGIAAGSLWVARSTSDRPLLRFGWTQLGLALAVVSTLPLYARAPYGFWKAHHLLARTEASWGVYQVLTFGLCAALLAIPTLLMGMGFPWVARAATRSVAEAGGRLGLVYLANTLGAVAGALAGAFLLLPRAGLEAALAVGVVLNLVGAGLCLGAAGGRRRAIGWGGAAAVLAAIFLCGTWGWSQEVAVAGTFRQRGPPPPSYAVHAARLRSGVEVLFRQDDSFATVMVGRERPKGELWLLLNGKPDASTGADAETQVLVGHLGPLLHPRAVRSSLVVGVGSGMSLGAVLTHAPRLVDAVEISPAVLAAARVFREHNRDALEDPRLRIRLEDAKTFMEISGARYDLVVSEPSNPWVAGVASLFTREFFRSVAEHLEPDGIFVQWIHAYELDSPSVRLVLRTLKETFPYGTTWLGPKDYVIVASRQPLRLDRAELARRMAQRDVRDDLGRVGVLDVSTLLAKQVHGQESFERLGSAPGPINTDDRNLLEYASPRAFFLATFADLEDDRRSPQRTLRRRDLEAGDPAQARSLYQSLAGQHELYDPLVRGAAERWLLLAPTAEAYFALGASARAQKDWSVAATHLRKALELNPTHDQASRLLLETRSAQRAAGAGGWHPGALE